MEIKLPFSCFLSELGQIVQAGQNRIESITSLLKEKKKKTDKKEEQKSYFKGGTAKKIWVLFLPVQKTFSQVYNHGINQRVCHRRRYRDVISEFKRRFVFFFAMKVQRQKHSAAVEKTGPIL